jgi:hypothetical protein
VCALLAPKALRDLIFGEINVQDPDEIRTKFSLLGITTVARKNFGTPANTFHLITVHCLKHPTQHDSSECWLIFHVCLLKVVDREIGGLRNFPSARVDNPSLFQHGAWRFNLKPYSIAMTG